MFTLIPTLTLALAMPAGLALAQPTVFQQGRTSVDDPAISSAELERVARVKIETAGVLGSELGESGRAAGLAREAAAHVFDLVLRGDAPADARELFENALGIWVEQLVSQGKQEEARVALEQMIGDATAKKLTPPGKAFLVSLGSKSSLRVTLADLNRGVANSLPIDRMSQEDMDSQVAGAAVSGRTDFVLQIGKRAAPGLLNALRAEADPYYEDGLKDPMYMLFRVDPLAGEAYVGSILAMGERSLFWNLRFAKAVSESYVLGKNEAWESHTMQGDKCRLVSILSVCDELIAEPTLKTFINSALRPVARHRAVTPAMLRYLEACMQSQESLPRSVSSWLADTTPMESLRPILLAGLASPVERNQRTARSMLMDMPSNDGVFALILAGGAELRSGGGAWLNTRTVRTIGGPEENFSVSQAYWTPAANPETERFLNSLFQDENPEVRKSTLAHYEGFKREERFVQHPGWPEFNVEGSNNRERDVVYSLADSTLRRLASDPVKDVRVALMKIAGLLPHDQLAALITMTVHDSDARIASTAWNCVAYLDWEAQPQASLDVIKRSIAEAPQGTKDQTRTISNIVDRLARTPAGLEIAARWAVETSSPDVVRAVSVSGGRGLRDQLVALPADLWVDLFLSVRGVPGVVNEMPDQDLRADQRQAAFDRILSDAELNYYELSNLVRCIEGGNKADNITCLTRIMRTAATDPEAEELKRSSLITMLKRMFSPEAIADAFSITIADQSLTADSLERMYQVLNNRGMNLLSVTPSLAKLIQAQTIKLGHASKIVHAALSWMGSNPEHADRIWIAELAGHYDSAPSAIAAIGRLKDPAMLPVLGKVIAGSPIPRQFSDAVRALSGFMSDEAAELLLIAARKTGDESMRALCLAEVEKIGALQDAEERWATRRVTQATRATTVSKLMAMLTSSNDNVRIQAIRGLATWEAVEAMPELIVLITDKNADVAKAAQAALDTINKQL